jgi:protein-tyrosine phosphatase
MPSALTLSGAPNFRDLGGYPTASGHTVRRHRLFRSDHLGALAPADLSQLASALGQSVRVLDLRGTTERESAMCSIPGATVHSLPIEPTILRALDDLRAAGAKITPADVVTLMQDTYRDFVRGNTPRFAALFGHVLQEHDAPIVFHCTAGKDRTGFAAAMLLLALGVPREVVMQDYLHTNVRLAGTVPAGLLPPAVAAVLWSVQEDFLQAAFEVVDADYGDLEAYLRDGLGLGTVERKRLRTLYLQAAKAIPASMQ